MATRYLSPTGNDTTGDGTIGNPWLTITKACSASVSGDTIMMAAGTYPVVTPITNAYLPSSKSLNFTGVSCFSTIITHGGYWFGGSGASYVFSDLGFTAVGGTWEFDFSYYASANSTFQRCFFYGLDDFSGSNGPFVTFGIVGSTLSFYSCIFKNLLRANSGYFANLYNTPVFNIANNVFYTAVPSALNKRMKAFSNNGCTGFMKNNIIMYVSSPAGVFDGPTKSYNCVYNGGGVPGTGGIILDPLFVDPTNNNFNLRPNSPCLGAGTLI